MPGQRMLFTVPLIFLGSVIVTPPAWGGECQAPTMSTQTVDTKALQGQIQATVATIGEGGGGINRGQHQEWEAQLPSQEAIDNQWYLYYLCVEYEAHRLNRDQYCALTSALWQRIVGQPVAVGDCASRAQQAPVAVEPKQAEPATVAAAPQAPVGGGIGAGDIRRGRWAALHASGEVIEMFGPVRMAGEELWYSMNDSCLGMLYQEEGEDGWNEQILSGLCTPWGGVQLSATPYALTVTEDSGESIVFDFADAAPATLSSGRWVGEMNILSLVDAGRAPVAAALLNGLMGGDHRLEISFEESRGRIHWLDTGCTGELTTPRRGAGWTQYSEKITEGNCADGGRFTLMALSNDAVLAIWYRNNLEARGILRPAD